MDVERNHQIRHNHPTQSSTAVWAKCICNCIRLARYLPFVLITSLFVWGMYTYMYYVVFRHYEQLWVRILIIIGLIPLYLLSFISYFKCVFARHRPISAEFYIPESLRLFNMTEDERNNALELLIQERNLPIFTRAYNGYVRYCQKCLVLKPDRAHHCSVCGRCICKMDHHCHWVSNCVAFDNYKYFMLFLSYTAILCIYVFLTSLQLFIRFWRDEDFPGKFQVFFLILFCCVFSVSIIILLGYHIYLVCRNVTTLESYQPPRFRQYEYDFYRYNLGLKRNFLSVFGDKKWSWFCPNFTSIGDGHCYQLPLIPGLYDKTNSLTVCDVTSSSYPQALLHQQHHHQTNNI